MPTEPKRKKVLLITRNLPPLVGGMERMMQQLALGISQYADLTVIGPRGCKGRLSDELTVHQVSSRLAPFLVFSTLQAIRACRSTQYDLIIGGSGLIGPTLRILAFLFRCRTLVYLHGLDLVVNNLLYQKVFVTCLRRVDCVAVNSRNTRKVAFDKGIDPNRIFVVSPGTNEPIPMDRSSRISFRQRHSIPFARYLLFTGRITRRKGLSSFLRHALPIILASEPEIGLVVVGDNPHDSLNQLGEQAEVRQQIENLSLQKKVAFLGNISDHDLELCYAEAAVQVFPLVQVPGDIEGFGMVAIEAAACGTPTVAFELGGVVDAISAGNGYLVPPGEFKLFAELVVKILREGEPGTKKCVAHARQFTWKAYNENIRKLIDGSTLS